jgi:hypothetical protein
MVAGIQFIRPRYTQYLIFTFSPNIHVCIHWCKGGSWSDLMRYRYIVQLVQLYDVISSRTTAWSTWRYVAYTSRNRCAVTHVCNKWSRWPEISHEGKHDRGVVIAVTTTPMGFGEKCYYSMLASLARLLWSLRTVLTSVVCNVKSYTVLLLEMTYDQTVFLLVTETRFT